MNTQSSHAQNSEQNQTTNTDSEQSTNNRSFGTPNPIKAYAVLFAAAKDHLDCEELKYLASLDEATIEETQSLSDVLMTMGGLIIDNDSDPSKEQMAEIAWGLSNHLQHITAMLSIANEARYYLDKRSKNPQA